MSVNYQYLLHFSSCCIAVIRTSLVRHVSRTSNFIFIGTSILLILHTFDMKPCHEMECIWCTYDGNHRVNMIIICFCNLQNTSVWNEKIPFLLMQIAKCHYSIRWISLYHTITSSLHDLSRMKILSSRPFYFICNMSNLHMQVENKLLYIYIHVPFVEAS